jgi:DNA-binding Xre family transcriptional regulator
MPTKRILRPTRRTAAQIAKEKRVRQKFQREKPSFDDLLAAGDLVDLTTQGEYFDLLKAMAQLKKMRLAAGLSLAVVSKRTGIDRAAISRLENGQIENPTLATLRTLAYGLGKQVVVQFRDPTSAR